MQPDALIFGFAIVGLLISIIIHEVSHGYAAHALGDHTAERAGRLTLNPIPHIDLLGSIVIPGILLLSSSPILFGWAKPVPYNPYNLKNQRWGEALVAGAGPGVNILIALFLGLVVRFGAGSLPSDVLSLANLLVYINVLLALFNLIPIPPLDGSKVLRSILPVSLEQKYARFEEFMARYGLIAAFGFIFLFIFLFGGIFFSFVLGISSLITGMPLAF